MRQSAALAKKLFRISSIRENFPEIGTILAPVIVEQFFASVCSLIISIILGRAGEAEVAAFNLIENLNFLTMQVFLSIGAGTAVVVAQYRGRGEPKAAGEAAIQALSLTFSLALLCSVVLMVFRSAVLRFILGAAEQKVLDTGRLFFTLSIISYPFLGIMNSAHNILRGSGFSRSTMPQTIAVNILYALLAWLTVAVLGLGIAGVGFSMIASRSLGAIYGLILVRRGNENLIISGLIPKKIDMPKIRIVLTIGVPAAVEQILFMSGRLLTQTFAIAMGTHMLAANSIGNSIYNFLNIPGIALQLVIVPLVGKYIGQGDTAKAKQIAGDCVLLGVASFLGVSLLLTGLLDPFISLFGQTAEVNETLRQILLSCMIATTLFMPASFILPGALRAAGDVKMTTVVSVASMFLFRVTLSYLLTNHTPLGILGIWMGMYFDWVVRSIIFLIRFNGVKWLRFKLI